MGAPRAIVAKSRAARAMATQVDAKKLAPDFTNDMLRRVRTITKGRQSLMDRRKFVKSASLAAATAAISAPAIAQSTPALKWRLTTSFPKTLDTLYGASELLAKTVGELSDQKFQISIFGPGEIVPSFQVLDAVANNTVEMGHSADYYYIG